MFSKGFKAGRETPGACSRAARYLPSNAPGLRIKSSMWGAGIDG